jgi:hypothetical protein
MSTETLTQRWEQIARSPVHWLISADDLRACSELVGQRFVDYFAKRLPPGTGETTEGVPAVSFGPIFLMLAGYSIEALVKSICVAREPEAVVVVRKGRRKLPDWLTTHDLEGLLKRAEVELRDTDRTFLRRLHASVVWSGRYPVDKSPGPVQKFSSTGDLAAFRCLYDKLGPLLQKEMRNADQRRR